MESKDNKETFNWPPLESDPEIFNNYMYKIGLPENFFFGEMFCLDEEILMTIPPPVLAVVVNYQKGQNKLEIEEKNKLKTTDVPFFMYQSSELDNACGLIAALHSVGHHKELANISKDSILGKFYEKCSSTSDEKERAMILENMNDFKEKHSEFSSQGQSKLCETQDEVCGHYVAFVLHGSQLVELNGARGFPVLIENNVSSENFLMKSAAEIKRRLEKGFITDNLSMMYLSKS